MFKKDTFYRSDADVDQSIKSNKKPNAQIYVIDIIGNQIIVNFSINGKNLYLNRKLDIKNGSYVETMGIKFSEKGIKWQKTQLLRQKKP